jgi:hypothetical protein
MVFEAMDSIVIKEEFLRLDIVVTMGKMHFPWLD